MNSSSDSDQVYGTRKRLVKFLLSGCLFGVLIIIVIYHIIPHGQENILHIISPLKEHWFEALSGIFIMFIGLALRGWRWAQLISRKGRTILFTAGYGVSQYWVFLLPARMGELARPLWFRKHGQDFRLIASSVVFERTFDVIILGLILLVLINFYLSDFLLILGMYRLLFIILLALLLGYISYVYIKKRIKRINIEAYTASQYMIFIIISVVAWIIHAYGFMYIFKAVGVDIQFGNAFLILIILNLSSVLSFAPGGLGTYEAVGTALLLSFGYAQSNELGAAIILHLAGIISLLLYVTLSWIYIHFHTQELQPSTT